MEQARIPASADVRHNANVRKRRAAYHIPAQWRHRTSNLGVNPLDVSGPLGDVVWFGSNEAATVKDQEPKLIGVLIEGQYKSEHPRLSAGKTTCVSSLLVDPNKGTPPWILILPRGRCTIAGHGPGSLLFVEGIVTRRGALCEESSQTRVVYHFA